MRASSSRLSRLHFSETNVPEKTLSSTFKLAGFGVTFMGVSRTLCAPSASPAFTKVAHRCLLAPTTTRDARELDAAKPVALFGDGATKRKSPQSARVFGIRVRVTA